MSVRAVCPRATFWPSVQSPAARYVKRTGQSNKRMQLTKLRAAPVWRAEVPPCAPAGQLDGGTASQLIRSVRRTCRGSDEASVTNG